MITIKQIAESLNVSPTTVSNVIHGNLKKVSPEMVDIVSRKLKELNYIPNMGARMLANGGSRIIGVVMNSINNESNQMEKYSIESGPFNSAIFSALEKKIRSRGYYMMFMVSRDVNEILAVLQSWNIDGMIVWGLEEQSCLRLKEKAQKPIVFIDCCFKEIDNCANIGLDDCRGGYLATRYLLDNGHRRIAFITDSFPLQGVSGERYLGYCKAYEERGLTPDGSSVIPVSQRKNNRMDEYEMLWQERERYTALFLTLIIMRSKPWISCWIRGSESRRNYPSWALTTIFIPGLSARCSPPYIRMCRRRRCGRWISFCS